MKNIWESGAIELLRHADSHIRLDSAFDKRIAFISIDNSIETAIRTFLNLSARKSGIDFPKKELHEAGNSFPKLVALVFKYAPDRVSGLDDGDIEHYHRIRNQLYHDGTGLSVDDRYLKAYRQISIVLLQNLFGVSPEVQVSEDASLENLILIWNDIEAALRRKMTDKGIAFRHAFKLEEAIQVGILDSVIVQQINDLRKIRNAQVHATPDQLDKEKIQWGVSLGKKILKKLSY